jgi:hypothetical protein
MMRPGSLVLFLLAVVVRSVTLSFAADQVDGNLIQFNENGAWCWYQDPRVLIDKSNNTVLICSVANSRGVDGDRRGGDVDVVTFHPDSGQSTRFVLRHNLQPQDDHNVPAVLLRPDGRYLAMYSRHNRDNVSYYRISTRPHDATDWQPERIFDWTRAIDSAGAHSHVTYSNLFYLSGEGKTYDFSRAINDDPSFLISENFGDTWSYGGKLLTEQKLGYVNGYTKYASNGLDRIDFLTTEHHPRDFNNSIYHGFIQDGKLHRSDGSVVEDDIFNSPGHPQTELTKVFAADSVFDGVNMTHAWTISIYLDNEGRPYALISARANDDPENTNFQDHRFFYARYDGTQWHVFQLAKAGARLWDAEQDYTGLAALNPSDPNVVYVSSTIDPRNEAPLAVHEIFQGRTQDGGQSWTWRPLTQNSTVDNLRPLVAAWDSENSLLVWFRGTMDRSQDYDCAMVGLLMRSGEDSPKVQFFPASMPMPAVSDDGAYDVFAYFWSEPGSDVQFKAGLSADRMMVIRPRSSQQAEASQFARPVAVTDGNRLLYRAYLGRIEAKAGQTIAVIGDKQNLKGLGYGRIREK